MHLDTRRVLATSLIEEIYPSYVQAWDHLQPHVAARHVLTFDEFAEEMTDPHIAKILVLGDDNQVVGMTTLITDISAVPWANAQFYELRFADEIARGTFFYVGYTFVHRNDRNTRAIFMMVREVDRVVKSAEGVAGFDMSNFVTTRDFGRRLDHVFPSALHIDHMDTQTYFVADYRPGSSAAPASVSAFDEFTVISMAEQPGLMEPVVELLRSRWPTFLLAGQPGHDVSVQPLLRSLPEFQIALIDTHGALRGAGLALPLTWDGTIADLPTGWDDSVRRAAQAAARGDQPNCSSALSITIAPEINRRRLGSAMVSGLARAARRAGVSSFIAPVRPTLKARYPLASMEDYLSWTTRDGDTFDPSLRTHLELGAELLTIAPTSMTISGSVREWETWTGLALPGSGAYVIDGGLSPLLVDRAADRGVYQEPSVWVHHRL